MRLVSLLLLFFCTALSAQKIKTGPIYEADEIKHIPQIMLEDEDKIYLVEPDIQNFIVEAFDKNTLKRIYSKKIEGIFPQRDVVTKATIEKVLYIDGSIMVVLSGASVQGGSTELLACKIDPKTGNKIETKQLYSANIEDVPKVGVSGRMWGRLGFYKIYISKNKKRFLAHYKRYNFDLAKFYEQLILFDSDMNVVLRKELDRESTNTMIPDEGVEVDDEGSIYYLQNNNIVFLDYFQNYDEWKEPLPKDIFSINAEPSKVTATFNNQNHLIITAAYVTKDIEDTEEFKLKRDTKEGDTQVEGMIFIEVDPFEKEILKVKVDMFDKSFLNEFKTKKHIKKGYEAEFENDLTLFRYHFVGNKTILLGHKYEKLEGVGVYYEHIVIFLFDENGELTWVHRIPKRQASTVSLVNEVCGYLSFIANDKVHVFFQDAKGNFKGEKRNTLNLGTLMIEKEALATVYTIDIDSGEMDYKAYADWNLEKDLALDPYQGTQKEEGAPIFIFGDDDDKYCLYRLDF